MLKKFAQRKIYAIIRFRIGHLLKSHWTESDKGMKIILLLTLFIAPQLHSEQLHRVRKGLTEPMKLSPDHRWQDGSF